MKGNCRDKLPFICRKPEQAEISGYTLMLIAGAIIVIGLIICGICWYRRTEEVRNREQVIPAKLKKIPK